MLSVIIDTLIICTATAFLLLCSGVEPTSDLAGMPYVQTAMSNVFGQGGVIFITVALFFFAFTTLLGNYFFAETGMAYLCGKTPSTAVRTAQKLLAIVVVYFGAVSRMNVVWDTADVLMGLMAVINVPVIFLLMKPVTGCLRDYVRQKKEGNNPVFKAKSIGLQGKTDFWQ